MRRLKFACIYVWCIFEFKGDHKAALRCAELQCRARLKGTK